MPSGLWEYSDVVTLDEDSMTKILEAMIESDKLDDESSPSKTHDITLPSSVEDFQSEYHLWTTPPPPSF